MLPRIVVFKGENRDVLLSELDIDVNNLIVFEGGEAVVKDFRHWINSTVEILKGKNEYTALIWDAHLLSWECQAVLLKPLEEVEDAMQILLVTEDENLLSETILSRCVVERTGQNKKIEEIYWPRVSQCWREGSGACMELSDEVSQEEALVLAEEVIRKMRDSLRKEINPKRVEILKSALVLAEEMKARNLNVKLCLGEFLLMGWQLAKT